MDIRGYENMRVDMTGKGKIKTPMDCIQTHWMNKVSKKQYLILW